MAQAGDGPVINPDSDGDDNPNPNPNPNQNPNQNPIQNPNQVPDQNPLPLNPQMTGWTLTNFQIKLRYNDFV